MEHDLKIKMRDIAYFKCLDFPETLTNGAIIKLRNVLQELESRQMGEFIFDMSKVQSIGSYALRLFANFANKLREQNGRVFFLNPNPAIRKTIETVRMDRVMPIFKNEDEVEEFILNDDKLLK